MRKLIFIDVETSGLIYHVNGIIELAYIIEVDGEVKRRGSYKINPATYMPKVRLDSKALEVNGYTEEQIAEFSNAKEAMKDFIAILNKYVDRWDKDDVFEFVGFNSRFDMDFVNELFKRTEYNFYQYISYRDLDVFALAKLLKFVGKFDSGKRMTLESCCKAIDLGYDAHSAVTDIEVTRDLFYKLIKEMS